MSFTTIPILALHSPPDNVLGAPTLAGSTNFDINGTSQYVACIVQLPVTGTIDRMWFRVNGATTGTTCLARLETVDTSTGLPTGTLYHANASKSVVIASGAADYEVTFDSTFTGTKGDLVAIMLVQNSGTTPSAIQIALFSDDAAGHIGLPYFLDYDASAALRSLNAPCWALGISSSSAMSIKYMWPINAVGTTTYQATSTPDTVGNRIVLPAPVRACGAWVWLDADSTGTVKLYGTDGATVLASATFGLGVPPSTSAFINYIQFTATADLVAGTYWLAVEATGGANIGVAYCDFPSAAWRAGSPMGGDMMAYATCTQTPANTGSWTVTDTRQAFLGLLIDGIDDAAGGGGGSAGISQGLHTISSQIAA